MPFHTAFPLLDGKTSLDDALEIHSNGTGLNTYYEIRTPLHLIAMYNTCGIPNVTDCLLSLSPAGAHYLPNNAHEISISNPHRHNYFELMILLKGKLMQEIEGREYLYSAGSCCLINRNITHTERFLDEGLVLFLGLSIPFVRELISGCRSDWFSDTSDSSNSVFAFMEENIRTDTRKFYLDFFPVYQKYTGDSAADPSHAPEVRNTTELHRFGDRLMHALLLPRPGAEFIIRGLLYELFDYLDTPTVFHIIPVKLSTKNDFLLFSRIRHLMQDTNGRMTRSQLEETLHYSGNYLNSIVKKHTGQSLFDYGMTFCLKRAEELLLESSQPISSIVESLHFTNWGHFNRLFEKAYGMSPRDYRRLHSKPRDSSSEKPSGKRRKS